MSLLLSDLASLASSTVTRSSGAKNASTLTVEEARAVVNFSVTDPKGSVDTGKKYAVLKLGQNKLSLAAVGVTTGTIACEEAQLQAVEDLLRTAIANGDFDAAIAEAQTKAKATFEKAQAKKDAPVEAVPVEEAASEEEAVADIGGLDLGAIEDELEV